MKIPVILCFICIALSACSDPKNTNEMLDSNTDVQGDVSANDEPTEAIINNEASEPDTEADTMLVGRQINSTNALSILRNVASIVSEDPIEDFLLDWQTQFGGDGHWINFPSGGADGILQIVDSGDLSEPTTLNYVDYWGDSVSQNATEFIDYSCASGGSAQQVSVPFVVNAHTLSECASTSGTYSGEALRMVSHHRPFIAIGHYKNLTFVDTQQLVSTLSGRFRDGGNQSFIGSLYTPSWTAVEFRSIQNSAPFAISRLNIAREESHSQPSSFTTGFFEASVRANFGVTADWTQQTAFDVKVGLSLYRDSSDLPEPFDWTSGSVSILAPDGSSMTIQIDRAKPEEFYITLENDESIGPFQWADGYRIKLSRHWD